MPMRALDRATDAEREAQLQAMVADTEDRGPRLLCANCGVPVTTAGARTVRGGSHEHHCTNPHGLVFDLGCFSRADVATRGAPSAEHTWFAGYRWQIALCVSCHVHLGWRFEGSGEEYFFGLILSQLREQSDP